MAQYFQNTITVTVPDKGGAWRVWDNPHSTPVRNYSMFITGPAGANNVTAEVFFGGYFTNAGGVQVFPYSDAATVHVGGISQGAAAAIGVAAWASKVLYSNAGVLPANSMSMPYPIGAIGLPIVVEFKNSNAVPYTCYLTFYGEELGTTV